METRKRNLSSNRAESVYKYLVLKNCKNPHDF